MKIHPLGAELFHEYRRTDGRTEMTKRVVAFHNFANAYKNGSDFYMRVFIPRCNVLWFTSRQEKTIVTNKICR